MAYVRATGLTAIELKLERYPIQRYLKPARARRSRASSAILGERPGVISALK